jgi:phosphate transport system substrate-binding protein
LRWIARFAVALAVAAGGLAAGCQSFPTGSDDVWIAGSDTMLPLTMSLAEAYMSLHPGVAVRVAGGGTSLGVDGLLSGSVDLCAASRPFRPQEIQALYERFGTMGIRYLVARDALVVLVHPDNPVRGLTMDQLSAVFSGTVRDWTELGAPSGPIEVVIRPPSSGTHHFFRDHVLLNADYAPGSVIGIRSHDVEDHVRSRPFAIGFGGMVQGEGLVQLEIDGVPATAETVREGSYPLARYLYFYAAEPPSGAPADFVEWCAGPVGQRVVSEAGFVPLWVD